MSEIVDAVAGTVGDLFGGQTEEASVVETETTAPEAEVEADEFPDWEAASRDLFTDDEDEVPDFNALADEELTATESAEDVLAPSEYDDEATARLKREALAAKKQAEYYQRQHLTTARKNWESDVRSQPWGEFLPKDLSNIKATSHRDFLKQAKATAKANYTVLQPHLEKLKSERERLKAQITQEAREEVQTAWGKPTVGGVQVPATAEQRAGDKLDSARKSRSMFRATQAMIEEGLI